MVYEYRIFYPLPANSGTGAPFDLFQPNDFAQVNHSAVKNLPTRSKLEERTDVYIIDTTWKNVESYGLKVRGIDRDFDPNDGSKHSYLLELKLRRSIHPQTTHAAAANDAHRLQAAASTSAPAATIGAPEDWKKFIRTSITSTGPELIRSALNVLENESLSGEKERVKTLMQELVPQMRAKVDDPKAYRYVEIRKKRVQIPSLQAEQTDIEVRILASPSASSSSASSSSQSSSSSSSASEVYRYRTICFEGDEKEIRQANIEQLFRIILARAHPNSSSPPVHPAASLAVVAGYPEFIHLLLNASSLPAPSSTSVAASSANPSASSAATMKRIELKKWNAVSLWSWDIEVDNVRR